MNTIVDSDDLRAINPTPHLNRSKVREFALDVARQTRGQKFERVGASFLLRIEAAVKHAIREQVRIHPSKGKTLL